MIFKANVSPKYINKWSKLWYEITMAASKQLLRALKTFFHGFPWITANSEGIFIQNKVFKNVLNLLTLVNMTKV